MRILVTAGPTREYLDTVRFLSNASSGRMGYAIADEAAQRGHEVVLVSGPVTLSATGGVETIRVISAAEMLREATARFPRCDAAIMAAAVCDERPVQRSTRKIARPAEPRSIEFAPTVDICARLGSEKRRRIVVGFAMEDTDTHRHAEAKLQRKHCDAIVLNRPETLGAETADVQIFRPDTGWLDPISGPKSRVAGAILDVVEALGRAEG